MLSYTVTSDGKSKYPKVDWSVPTSSMFWQYAINALSENEFFPALVEGKTVDSDFKSITVFKIEDPNKLLTTRLKHANKPQAKNKPSY